MDMLIWIATAAAIVAGTPSDTMVVLGTRSLDMTGDGQAEVLEVIGVGESLDSLEVTFSITSAGRVLFSEQLQPITRTIGFDAGKRTLSSAEHRKRLEEFGDFFFDPEKFMRPAEFVSMLEQSARRHIARIPEVIARSRAAGADTMTAADLWEEIQSRAIFVFQYSGGGDGVNAIAWSPSDERFYHLWECC